MKHALFFSLMAASLFAAAPEISEVEMSQGAGSRLVTITYKLSAAAVVTLDVQTNANDGTWASIGGAAIANAEGDVWKKIDSGSGVVTWRPDLSWPDHKVENNGARAVLTAWSLDNTPDYMVVNVAASALPETQKYYPSADFLPGGLLENSDYRIAKLVMRKIMAKGVEWTMGSTTMETQRTVAREATHYVTLTNNYYIGVFPVTQGQFHEIAPDSSLKATYTVDGAMRPMEKLSYNEIRNSADTTADARYDWPNDPNPISFLGLLRAKTQLDFDLPSEAQWEFACRAGNGSGRWGDGSPILNTDEDANLAKLARYQCNGGQYLSDEGKWLSYPASALPESATSLAGAYLPNSWGIYDMCGNVWEWCLDWDTADISDFGGKINIDPETPANTLAGKAGASRILRGGSWVSGASYCRPAYRSLGAPSGRNDRGCRVVCTAGLK